MVKKRRTSAKPSKRGKPAHKLRSPAPVITAERPAEPKRRRFYLKSPYLPLLLRAIRDGVVHDWTSLRAFQEQHKLQLVQFGTVINGAPPPVEDLLKQLRDAGLITVEGMEFRNRLWVRRDNFTKAPRGVVVYDPHGLDRDNRLGGHRQPRIDLTITLAPHWADIQDALGISLETLAALQSPRARVVAPDIFPESGADQNDSDVFVLMPFDGEMRPVYDDHIRRVCGELSLSARRGDDFFKAHAIMADIWGAIQRARVIIADCTGRNANVFYEMGIAHVLGKPVILVSQDQRDIPFDIGSIRYILYEYTPRGMKTFDKQLKAALTASIA